MVQIADYQPAMPDGHLQGLHIVYNFQMHRAAGVCSEVSAGMSSTAAGMLQQTLSFINQQLVLQPVIMLSDCCRVDVKLQALCAAPFLCWTGGQ